MNGTKDDRLVPEPPVQPLIILLCLGSAEAARQHRAPPPTPSNSPAVTPALPPPPPVGTETNRPEQLYANLIGTLRARGAEVLICPNADTVIRYAWARANPHAIIVVDDMLFRPEAGQDRVLREILDAMTVYVVRGGRLIFRPSFDDGGALQPMFRERFGLDWQTRGRLQGNVRRGDWLDHLSESLLERMPEVYHTRGVFIDSTAPSFPVYYSTGLLRQTNDRVASCAAGRVGNGGWLLYLGDDREERVADEVVAFFCGLV